MTAGHPILIVDLAGGISPLRTLGISSNGTDTINGVASGTVTIPSVFGALYLVSDSVRGWVAYPLGGFSLVPGGGLASSVSAACSQSPIAGLGVLSVAECVNPQTGTSYPIQDGDRGKLITASNAAAQAYSIGQAAAASAFQGGWYTDIHNISTAAAGIVTVTPLHRQLTARPRSKSTRGKAPGSFRTASITARCLRLARRRSRLRSVLMFR
jgi:hypothetical protein